MAIPNNVTQNDLKLLKEKYSDLTPIFNKINEDYPIPYLIGNVSFYGYQINVNENVLIPRFETEGLIEKTINYIKKLDLCKGKIIDFGTGSGCISIALQKEIPSLIIDAIDNSEKALNTAKDNAKINNLIINFQKKDIFTDTIDGMYDIIISNPPYIKPNDTVGKSTSFEPQNAIYVYGNPLKYYDKILELSKEIINQRHLISFEIDEEEGINLSYLAKKYYPNDIISIEKDLNQKDRYLFIYHD